MDKQEITLTTNQDHLQKLLQFVPPAELRKSVQTTLFAYLLEQDDSGLDLNYKKIVEDIYFLIDFLDKVDYPLNPSKS